MRLLTRATIFKNKHTRQKNATGIDVEDVQGIAVLIFMRDKISAAGMVICQKHTKGRNINKKNSLKWELHVSHGLV